MKKLGKWLLLLLSVFCSGLYWKYLLQEFLFSYWLTYKYAVVAICCTYAAYCLGRDLLLISRPVAEQPAEKPPETKKTELGKVMTELDLFVIYNKSLLDKFLTARGESIELRNGVEFYSCKYWLVAGKTADSKDYYIKIFHAGGKIEAPFNPEITDHLDLLDHLWWILRDYGNSPYTGRDLSKEGRVIPLKRQS